MNAIQLDVTLSVVGPRALLLQQAKWPMALRVAAGFAQQPGDVAEAEALVLRSLPWKLWPALPDLLLVDELDTRIPCQPATPLAEKPAFLQAVKDSVEQQGLALCDPYTTLNFQSAAGVHGDVIDEGGIPSGVPWAGLLKTLTSMAQPTPSALHATWFFLLDRASVCTQNAQGDWELRRAATLAAAPATLEGEAITNATRHGSHVAFDYAGGRRTYCNVLDLHTALGHGLDELDNYWLTLRDSRDDSLLDLASRLDSALAPSAMLGSLRAEELAGFCEYRDAHGARPCTASELSAAVAAWRTALENTDTQEIAAVRQRVIRNTLASPGVAADALRAEYRQHAIDLLGTHLAATGTPVQVAAARWPEVGALLSERLLPHAFEPAEPGPSTSGESVSLVVGDERLRLVHESQAPAPGLDEVAAVQLWARRSTDPAALVPGTAKPATWHALTAGRYVPSEDQDNKRIGMDRVFGCSAAYVEGVLCREIPYLGMNLVCRNPLERAHREKMGDGDWGLRLAKVDRLAAENWELLAVPLRYGDHYEFAASVIDRAGGQAVELSQPGLPWEADLGKIALLDPPQRDPVHFLRRVPLGTCKKLPLAGDWPKTPRDVVLRSLEREPAPPPGETHTWVCLVPDDPEHFLPPVREGEAPGPARWPSAVDFAVEPPQTDEYTAMRWLMPATNIPRAQQQAELKRLETVVAGILAQRDRELSTAVEPGARKPQMVTDPAAGAIGIRWRIDGGKPEQTTLPATRHTFKLAIGAKTGFDRRSVFTVAPGSYLRVGIHVLVGEPEFERLDARALAGLLEPAPWKAEDGTVFRAFKEDAVIVECASHEMPQPEAALLRLSTTPGGDVDVAYAFSKLDEAAASLFQNVDRMMLASRRWTWRNLPVPPQDPGSIAEGSEEWRRRLASGPPLALFDPALRDSDPEVDYYDQRSELDTGFLKREDLTAQFPRNAVDATVLFSDGREGLSAADYLKYAWTVRSRYAGVLVNPERTSQPERRLAAAFRGDRTRIKPPRMLELRAQASGFSYDSKALNLAPYRNPHAAVKHQYRHVLIVGHMVRDGGRAVDVFMPSQALWLGDGKAQPLGADAALARCTHGVVAEILLSGRYDPAKGQTDLLAGAAGLADLFRRLLPDSVGEDAPGMFRRFSPIGRVQWRA